MKKFNKRTANSSKRDKYQEQDHKSVGNWRENIPGKTKEPKREERFGDSSFKKPYDKSSSRSSRDDNSSFNKSYDKSSSRNSRGDSSSFKKPYDKDSSRSSRDDNSSFKKPYDKSSSRSSREDSSSFKKPYDKSSSRSSREDSSSFKKPYDKGSFRGSRDDNSSFKKPFDKASSRSSREDSSSFKKPYDKSGKRGSREDNTSFNKSNDREGQQKPWENRSNSSRDYNTSKETARGRNDKKEGGSLSRFQQKSSKTAFDKSSNNGRPSASNVTRLKSDNKFGESNYEKKRYGKEDSKTYKRTSTSSDSYRKDKAFPSGKSKKIDLLKSKKSADSGEIRLNRYLSNAGVASRRAADELIMQGFVTVNGKVITELGSKVKPGDEVCFKGKRLIPEKFVYLVMNKPKNHITTSNDPKERQTVMHLFKDDISERVFPVGRLDRNTTGVLLFTNDGDFAQQLSHPSFGVKKVYKALLDKPLNPKDFDKLVEGVELEDGVAFADALALLNPEATEVGIEIHSGKNRIIHRMFNELGYEVEKLDRVSYGGITKERIKPGEYRELSANEINLLRKASGQKRPRLDA